MPDYNIFENHLKNIALPNMSHDVVGLVHGYPFHRLLLGTQSQTKPNILLSSGIHGDEPAGVEAILQFLTSDLTNILNHFHITILPCVNPSGYANDLRENINGDDINRGFETDELPEVDLIKKAISNQHFLFHHDLHEDYDATGSYFYEGHKKEQWLTPTIAQLCNKIGPLDTPDEDDDNPDLLIAPNTYKISPAWGLQGFVSYTLHKNTDHVLITETSSNWPMPMRVEVHLTALNQMLAHYMR